eukprot:gene24163-9750_t
MSEFLAPSSSTAVNNIDPELGARSVLYDTKRPRRDTVFTVIYCLLAAFTFFGGIATFTKSDKDLAKYSSDFYANSTTCDIASFTDAQASKPVDPVGYDVSDTFVARYTLGVAIWLPITTVAGVAFVVIYVLLFIKAAVKMVWIGIYASVAVTLAIGAIPIGIIMVVLAVIVGVMYWFMRDQLALCAKLLAISGRGLKKNMGLGTTAIVLKLAVHLYIDTSTNKDTNKSTDRRYICGTFVGRMGYNRLVATRVGTDTSGACYDNQGFRVDCCAWQIDTWASVYCAISLFTVMWTVQLVLGLKLYIVAATISTWYFCPAGTPSDSPQAPSVMRSVRQALGASFGSIAFGSLIITVIEMIRDMLRRAARDNIFCCIINCIAQPILAMCEQFTRFAIIACAITGLPFIAAAKHVFGTLKRILLATYSLWYIPNLLIVIPVLFLTLTDTEAQFPGHLLLVTLKRNFLATYSLWYVPSLVLNITVLLGGLIWGAIVYFCTYLQFKSGSDVTGLCFAVAGTCFALMAFILFFVAHLLLDIVNTIYICYAMDRDAQQNSHPEIHEIYSAIPTLQGALVQNPDGALAYGAQDQQQYSSVQPAAQPAYGGYPPAGYPQGSGYPSQQPPQYYGQSSNIQMQKQAPPPTFGK